MKPIYDPLSNFWSGAPVWYDGVSWPTRQHAMTLARLMITSTETADSIKATLMKFAENDPYRACYYKLMTSQPTYQAEWDTHKTQFSNSVMITSAFQSSHVMMALLHLQVMQDDYPNSVGFIYRGNPFRNDFFWDGDG